MKTACFLSRMAFAVLALVPSTGFAADQFVNGGFENNFSGWEAGGDVSLQSAAP